MIFSEDIFGEILAIIPKHDFENLPRNIDLFREGLRETLAEENESIFPDNIVVMIWINERYRMANRVPADIEDCFLAWAASSFGTTGIIRLEAFPRVFPKRLRSGLLMEEMFHE